MTLFNRKELPKEEEEQVLDKIAQELVESWLTDTLNRQIFTGHELSNRLRGISESLAASEEQAQDYIRTWLTQIDGSVSYRSSVVQGKLLDLWAYISHYSSGDIEEPSIPSVS